MAFWVLDQWYDTLDYPALGFVAEPDDVLEATHAPDPRWSEADSGPETVTRYGTVDADPSYEEPGDGHILAWSDDENAYVPVAPDDFLIEAGREVFADYSIQAEVETGRLNDSVLTQRFGRDSLYFGANQMTDSAGSPSDSAVNGVPVWRLDKATDERVSLSTQVPRSWSQFNVILKGFNLGAGTGYVRLKVTHTQVEDGEVATTADSGVTVTLEVDAENVRQSVTARYYLNVPDTGATQVLQITREGTDGIDNLDNDWALMGVELVATEYAEVFPELPEEPENLEGQAFPQESNDDLGGLRVWHSTPPPPDDTDDGTFKYFPLTDISTLQDFTTSTNTTIGRWSFLWGVRHNYDDAVWNKRPNYLWGPAWRVNDRECRATFSTLERAMAAQRAQVRHIIGMDSADVEAPWVAVGGDPADIVTESYAKTNRGTLFTEPFDWDETRYIVAQDTVILPHARLVDVDQPGVAKGIVLDYEVGDNRTTAETLALIEDLADDIHGEGYELFFYSNPLTAGTQQYHGVDATNAPGILAACDLVGVMLMSALNPEGDVELSFNAQTTRLGVNTAEEWEKVVVVFELGIAPGTTVEDAEWLYEKLHEEGDLHPTKIYFWRFSAVHGGDPMRITNQKISWPLFGRPTWEVED